MRLSYKNYREACAEGFSVTMCNPTIYWNRKDGFYVAPSRNLIPNEDLSLGLCYYDANSGCRSHRGTRREYKPILAGIKKFISNPDMGKSIDEVVECEIMMADYDSQF